MSLFQPKKNILRGTYAKLKRFCKDKNLPNRWIKKDEERQLSPLKAENGAQDQE